MITNQKKHKKWAKHQLIEYIDTLIHSCSYHPTENVGHMIRNCKGREKWVKSFLEAYAKGWWKPKLYGAKLGE